MRKMTNDITTLNIKKIIITKNFWEYFITDNKFNDDIVEALVMGFETEIGDVSLSEIKPYILSQSTNLTNVMPASGWKWLDD